jgi:DNA-binding NtrC family response regulator
MLSDSGITSFSILVFKEEIRRHISEILLRNHCSLTETHGLSDLTELLKNSSDAIVFIGSDAVMIYGAGVISKLKMACNGCRIILLCEKVYRTLIKDMMGVGVYGCIVEPYPEWEIQTMVKLILTDLQKDRPAGQKGKRPAKKKTP